VKLSWKIFLRSFCVKRQSHACGTAVTRRFGAADARLIAGCVFFNKYAGFSEGATHEVVGQFLKSTPSVVKALFILRP
jgi:hypothetical protein